MNYNTPNAIKNQLYFGLTFTFLLLINITVSAQSKENTTTFKELRESKNDAEKVKLLLRLSMYYLNKDGEFKEDLDKAADFSKQASLLSDRLNYKQGKATVILQNAKIYREKGDSKNGRQKTLEAIAYSKNNNFIGLMAESYDELSMYDAAIEEKAKYKNLAIVFYKKSGAIEKQACALKELANLYNINGNAEKSEPLLKESLALYTTIKFPHLQGVYNLLSEVNYLKEDFSEALKYGLLAEKTAIAVHDNSLQLSSIYNHIGLIYYSMRQNQDAKEYWQKAFDIAIKHNDTEYIRTISENICSVLIRQKKEKEALALIKELQVKFPTTNLERQLREAHFLFRIYIIMHNNKEATIYYKKLKKYISIYEDKEGLGMPVLRSFAEYYYQIKKYDDFYTTIKHLDSLTSAKRNSLVMAETHLLWFKADSSRGNYVNAIKHYQLYKKISDSVFKGEKSKQINGLQIEFQSEKKDKNIELLQQKAKVQEVSIHNNKIVRYLFITSLIILLLLFLLLYNRYRLKKKINEQLEIKRQQVSEQNELNKKMLVEKEWLLKEIHHRVKNNLQIVISLLNTQSNYLDNEDALIAIQSSKHRMYAMSVIHQKLYQSDNLAKIDISWYISELITYMRESFDTDEKIKFILETEQVDLDIAQAVPMGLIINETVSNAIKYAFPLDRKGKIRISLKNTGQDTCQLIIEDDGVGLPEGFDKNERNSLGLNLIMGLTNQIDGVFEMINNNGLKIKITFTKSNEFAAASDHFDSMQTLK